MLGANIIMAFAELKANKARSFLTMLGIIIGIASVIAIMTVGEAMNRANIQAMNEMGADNIDFFVSSKKLNEDSDYTEIREMRANEYFTEDKYEDLLMAFSGKIKGISIKTDGIQGKIGRSGKDLNINIYGVNNCAEKANKLNIIAGADITEDDEKLVVISSKLAERLFGDSENAVGKNLEYMADGRYYDYIISGVYEHKSSQSDFDTKSATDCFVPLKTMLQQTNEDFKFQQFTVIALPEENAETLATEITDYVNGKYYANNEDYQLEGYSNKEWMEETAKMENTTRLAMSAIAAISLIVGGIGVMNILIVSITERTREIGTRKAIGATNRSIKAQFLTESIVMCLIGGIFGIIIGVIIGLIISHVLGYPGAPPIKWIIISVLFSVAFGVFFGLYPASKAAKMNPTDALRYE